MKAQEPDFIKEYINWIKNNSAQRFINGYTEITTPFLDSHNDAIQFYVKREGESFLFTDDGYTFADIEMNGLNLNTKKRKELVQFLADSMNVTVKNGTITAKASSSTLVAQTEHFMIQAMLKFNDLFYLASPQMRGFFLDEVKTFFDENDIRCTSSVMFSGRSGLPQRFDFVVPASRTQPERVITTLNQPTKQNVQSAIFSWTDVRESRKDSISYLILNHGNKKNNALSDAARQYGMKPFWWGERDKYIGELVS